ncbi:hypothetical protein P9112_014314 [Eukaryota sp. TZLM1-RC]
MAHQHDRSLTRLKGELNDSVVRFVSRASESQFLAIADGVELLSNTIRHSRNDVGVLSKCNSDLKQVSQQLTMCGRDLSLDYDALCSIPSFRRLGEFLNSAVDQSKELVEDKE